MISSTQTNSPFVTPAVDQDAIILKLRNSGLRITQPRLALLSVLCRMHQPATIEQLYSQTGSETCDLVTFYRCIAAFEKAGVVYRSGFGERGAALYFVASECQRRYPLVRKGTDEVEQLDEDLSIELHAVIESVQQKLRERGYRQLEHIVEFFAEAPLAESRHAILHSTMAPARL